MSVKDKKFRMGLNLVVVLMLGMVIYNVSADVKEYDQISRRVSAIDELKNMVGHSDGRYQVAKH